MEAISPQIYNYDTMVWRGGRYFVEECDDVLKFYRNALNLIYLKYAVKKVKPGQKPFMCLDEFHDISSHAGFFDLNCVERDVNLAFNLSMMTQVDELENDRIFQMSFLEFMEGIARLADKLSF